MDDGLSGRSHDARALVTSIDLLALDPAATATVSQPDIAPPAPARRGAASKAAATRRRMQRLHRMLRDARAEVEARDELISMISHDLRSPLAIIQLHLQSLLRNHDPELPDWVGQRLRKADRVTSQALRLLTDLLDASRAGNGRPAPAGDVELQPFISDILTLYREQLAAAGCETILDCPPDMRGNWNQVLLFQIVSNLLCNAIKYAAGQPVEIRVTRQRRRLRGCPLVRIEFCDHGDGIPTSRQRSVFERFERGSDAVLKGYGLGLWIVRTAVGKLGGSIRLQSSERGTVFVIDLPA